MDETTAHIHTELLVIQLRNGNVESFRHLVEMWEKRLFYYVRRIVWRDEDAWDILQETWVKVHAKIRNLSDPSAFPAWIYRIARHAAISHLRKKQRRELLEEDYSQQEIHEEMNSCHFSEDEAARIHWGLDQLPLPQREALTLFFLESFSLSEIASITGISVGTIKSRLH
jgi:RNA polymerase sigma-70 factor, ECF subfamily